MGDNKNKTRRKKKKLLEANDDLNQQIHQKSLPKVTQREQVRDFFLIRHTNALSDLEIAIKVYKNRNFYTDLDNLLQRILDNSFQTRPEYAHEILYVFHGANVKLKEELNTMKPQEDPVTQYIVQECGVDPENNNWWKDDGKQTYQSFLISLQEECTTQLNQRLQKFKNAEKLKRFNLFTNNEQFSIDCYDKFAAADKLEELAYVSYIHQIGGMVYASSRINEKFVNFVKIA